VGGGGSGNGRRRKKQQRWTAKKLEITFSLWCLNPAAGFASLDSLARSVVITSGMFLPRLIHWPDRWSFPLVCFFCA
jgi:hypothetical protein